MARILIAEDNVVTAEMLRARLSGAGHEIVLATDGNAALRQAIETRPDLILLDVMLPELDGFEVLQRLKADPVLGAIPVVVLSARTQEQDILTALANGADDYLTKPFRFRELLARLDRVRSEARGYLRVAVRGESGRSLMGELVQGGAQGASVRFLREVAPILAIGERATLSLRSPALPHGIELAVTLEGRAESEPHRTYRFRLPELESANGEATRAFLRLVGRRISSRVAIDPAVAGLLRTECHGEPVELAAALHDVSVTGARMVLKGQADRLLAGVEGCSVRFGLPGVDLRFEMVVSICHREACEGGVSYGMRFEAEGSPRLVEQQREIAEFVIRWQSRGR